jgi:hypothetical protein
MKKDRFHYPILSLRLEEEIKDWLKEEKKKYKSWNLFFRELQKRYGLKKLPDSKEKQHN